MKDKKCSSCNDGKIDSNCNKSGLCRECLYLSWDEKRKTEEFRIKRRQWEKEWRSRPEVKEKLKLKGKEYSKRPKVKERRRERAKERYNDPKIREQINKLQREYRRIPENRKKINMWRRENKQRYQEYYNDYRKKRIKEDLNFKIACLVRIRLRKVLNKYTSEGKIMSSNKYGINFKKIIEHLKPFPADTSKYHIDHIKPLASFNFVNGDGTQNLEEIRKAFAPENHQWLLAEDNLMKSDKIIEQSKLF